jgi:hypothetical protein
MVDVHPDELKHRLCKMAWLYVHPNTGPMEAAQPAKHASAFPASIATKMPPGTLSKT